MKSKPSIILASASPRRRDLLNQVGFSFKIVPSNTDETPLRHESPKALVRRLAYEKGVSVYEKQGGAKKRVIIISADTIVVSPDGKHILGKPRTTADARKMLRLLQGKTHWVHTGYCLIGAHKIVSRVITSRVTLRRLSSEIISKYIATGEPMDKAGSYAAQGLGIAFIEKINGSYTNVVGLPISQLLGDLELSFGVLPPAWGGTQGSEK